MSDLTWPDGGAFGSTWTFVGSDLIGLIGVSGKRKLPGFLGVGSDASFGGKIGIVFTIGPFDLVYDFVLKLLNCTLHFNSACNDSNTGETISSPWTEVDASWKDPFSRPLYTK